MNNRFLVYINAGNDRNGNPRRGWVEYETLAYLGYKDKPMHSAVARQFLDYNAIHGNIPKEIEHLPVTGEFSVSVKEYRFWLRFEAARQKREQTKLTQEVSK